MWDIIVWDKEDAIDFVPSSWANEDNTLYKHPTSMSDSKIRQLIYDCQDFDSEQHYKWSKASVKKLHIRTLKKAKELCKKGQFSSDIEDLPTTDSEVNDGGQGKRKRKRNMKFVIEDESEEEEGDSEDSSEPELEYRKTVFKIPSTPKPLKTTTQKQTTGGATAVLETKNKKGCNEHSRSPQPPTNTAAKNRSGIAPEIDDTIENDNLINDNSSSGGSIPSTVSCTSSGETNFLKEFARSVLRNQASIEFKLQRLERSFETLENRLLRNNSVTIEEQSVLINLLPCTSMQDIEFLENLIKVENDKYSELVNLLYLVGGDTVSKTTYAVLRKLLVNEVCLLFSGQGKKHKLSFSKLTLNTAVAAAIRKRHTSATDEEIKKTISTYLAQTKARMSGKQN